MDNYLYNTSPFVIYMDKKELRSMDVEEANTKLDDEEFEEWQEARKEYHLDNVEENSQKWAERDREAVQDLMDSAENSLKQRVEVLDDYELEVFLSLNQKQRDILFDIQKLSKELKKNELNEEDANKLEEYLVQFLSEVSVNYSREHFEIVSEKMGMKTLDAIAGEIIREVHDEEDKIGNFR